MQGRRTATLWLPLLLLGAGQPALAQQPATPEAPDAAGAAAPATKPADLPQSPTEDLFARKCGSCHTVGKGKRVGPDLKDAHKRRSRAWLEGFVRTPSAMLDNDADARNLLTEFGGVRMPDLGLTPPEAKGLVDLLVRCSSEPCNLAGKFTAATVATAQDVARGRALFTGSQPLKSGGAPCLSCHVVRGQTGPVPGGLLGKDLTHVFARIGDEGLDAALANPAYPLMNRVFKDHPLDPAEVFALRAFLYKANLGSEPAAEDALSLGLFAGLLSAGVLFGLNAAWARRLKGVRKPLTERKA